MQRYDRVVAYKPILETSQLPLLGPLSEDLRFDMKMEIKEQIDKKPIEQQIEDLACDVAAFANTAGGVLLIGAHEHPKDSGILHAYKPMTQPDAMLVFEALKKAVDLCSPKPIIDPKLIASRDGKGFIVAINCDPYAAPPIGVAKSGQRGGEKWWAFPARRGRDNRPLRPEELATIMQPRLRRMLLLLDQIPTFAPQGLRRAHFHSQQGSNYHTLDIMSISTETSSIQVCQPSRPGKLIVPLDAIRMIWRDSDGVTFHVSVIGKIRPTDTSDVGLEFVPA